MQNPLAWVSSYVMLWEFWLLAKLFTYPGLLVVKEAEALCLYKAISSSESLGLRNVIFESDVKTVVDVVHYLKLNNSEFGSLANSSRSFLVEDDEYSLCFIRR
ncbi:hypothetical protein DITRI_Ditri10aG0134200 [Diplodiscus trichospermus]